MPTSQSPGKSETTDKQPVVYIPELPIEIEDVDNGGFESKPLPTFSGIPNEFDGLIKPMNQIGNSGPSEIFNGKGPVFEFLGDIEKSPVSSLAITIDSPQGSGKTRLVFQMLDAFASSGYKSLMASLEEHPGTKVFKDKVNQYISPVNQSVIHAVGYEAITTMDDLERLSQHYDVIFIDSASKVIGFDLDRLRRKYKGKLFVVIYQRTTDGNMRGGSAAAFDGDAIMKIRKEGDFRMNYAYWDKNRYQDNPNIKYSIYHQNIIQDEE